MTPLVFDAESPREMQQIPDLNSSRADRPDDEGQKSSTSSGGGWASLSRTRRNPIPLVVKVEQEQEVTYDVRSSSEADFLAREARERRTIGGTPRDSSFPGHSPI